MFERNTNPIVGLTDAEVARGRPVERHDDTYLIEAEDGRTDHVPRTGKYELLVETDAFDQLFDDGGIVTFEPTVATGTAGVTFQVTEDDRNYVLSVDGNSIVVSDEDIQPTLEALKTDLEQRQERDRGFVMHDEDEPDPGAELYYQYQDCISDTVREDVVNAFVDQFPDSQIRETDSGWVVADTFVVDYEAENYYLDESQTYVVNGSEVVATDEAHQALDLETVVPEEGADLTMPDGMDVTLSDQETQFLATVQFLLQADRHLPTRIAHEIVRAKDTRSNRTPFTDDGSAEQFTESEQPFGDDVDDVSADIEVTGFQDDYSGISHGVGSSTTHEIDKHTLPEGLNVTQRALDELMSNYWDHLAVHELKLRRGFFENASFDVFDDVGNGNSDRWRDIRRTASNAPVDDDHLDQLEQDLRDAGYPIDSTTTSTLTQAHATDDVDEDADDDETGDEPSVTFD